MTYALDGRTLFTLKEIDTLNKEALESLNEMKGRSVAIYSLPTQVSLPFIPNEEKIDSAWRKAMQEDWPIYFNPDGTRTNKALKSRSHSRSQSRTVTPIKALIKAVVQPTENRSRSPILTIGSSLNTA